MKSYFLSLNCFARTEHQATFPHSTVPVRPNLDRIDQIKLNLISFADENDKKALTKFKRLLVKDSGPVCPVW